MKSRGVPESPAGGHEGGLDVELDGDGIVVVFAAREHAAPSEGDVRARVHAHLRPAEDSPAFAFRVVSSRKLLIG